MNDTASPDDNVDAAPDQGTLLGQALQEARQKRKLTIEDVCNRLRISLRQVKALEADDFAALPEAMITRGFIRNYARLLDIDVEPLLAAYRASAPKESPHAISIQSENVLILGGDKRHWRMYVLASLLIALLVAAWLIFVDYHPQLPTRSAAEAVSSAMPSASNTSANSAVSEQQSVSEPMPIPALPAAERAPEETAAALTPATTNAAADAGPPAKLKFSFSEQTWLSVKDRANKSIVNKNKPAGSGESIEGQPPFKIIIGNATGSTLIYNDKPVDLGSHTKDNVVHLTLE